MTTKIPRNTLRRAGDSPFHDSSTLGGCQADGGGSPFFHCRRLCVHFANVTRLSNRRWRRILLTLPPRFA